MPVNCIVINSAFLFSFDFFRLLRRDHDDGLHNNDGTAPINNMSGAHKICLSN